MKKNLFAIVALVAVFALLLTGCGKKEETVPTDGQQLVQTGELGLSQWDFDAYAWSSNNGATVSIKAVPNYYTEGMTASFVIRLEGEEVETVECAWDNGAFVAEADLNSEDGLCYYMVLTAPDGEEKQVEVNTPANPIDEMLINLEHSLESYCHMDVTDFAFNGTKLTVNKGTATVQLPLIGQDGGKATCEKAELILLHNEEEVARQALTLPTLFTTLEVSGISFDVPAMQDDEQLRLTLEVTLTDGQVMSAPACTWFYNDSQLLPAVG